MTSSPTYAADFHIKVDGVTIASDVKPEVKSNRTMVPLRVISENLGQMSHGRILKSRLLKRSAGNTET